MLDLSFGLPLAVRDAALKMAAPGPTSDINREYFAQNNERAIEEGKVGTEEYEKVDGKARELLRRLANSKPYFRKGRAVEDSEAAAVSTGGSAAVGAGEGGPGPIRTRDSRAAAAAGRPKGRAFPSAAQLPPSEKDWLPPKDKNLMSLFVTGIEDDLPEYKLRDFFKAHGKIKSLVCSHQSHCAFVNYETRAGAETAADACRGKAIIAGCPLRVRWGVPKAIGNLEKEDRVANLRDARGLVSNRRQQRTIQGGESQGQAGQAEPGQATAIAAPPGASDTPQYASLAGD